MRIKSGADFIRVWNREMHRLGVPSNESVIAALMQAVGRVNSTPRAPRRSGRLR